MKEDIRLQWMVNSFGGVLLRQREYALALNGGDTMENLENAYGHEPLCGLILTSEHINRRRNAVEFAEKHNVPVIVSASMFPYLSPMPRRFNMFFPPNRLDLAGFDLEFIHVRYDSSDPIAIIIRNMKKKLGIVFDGKLNEFTAKPFLDCSELLLENCYDELFVYSSPLARRLRSVTNNKAELQTLFADFKGIITLRYHNETMELL